MLETTIILAEHELRPIVVEIYNLWSPAKVAFNAFMPKSTSKFDNTMGQELNHRGH